ncbi:MAG TPA: hypothetical protein VD999_05920 [Vitreimonas sp.]|nr:hypothetical protein [Vitreimonas sp.]
MSTYYCLLGNTPDLSAAEIAAFFPDAPQELILPHILKLEIEGELDTSELLYFLGGTVKLLKELTPLEMEIARDEDKLAEALADQFMRAVPEGKITFGIAEHGRDHLPRLEAAYIKSLLQKQDVTAKYYEDSRTGLSAAILIHHPKVVELHIIQTAEQVVIARTVAVQDIEEWTYRDREKPYFDRKKGMLPPKVSRMMANIGLGTLLKLRGDKQSLPTSSNKTLNGQYLLYDPFCGTGTVLAEALLTGANVVGSDSDAVAVKGTQANLQWLEKKYDVEERYKVFTSEVANVPPTQLPSKIDVIVTEPFLGKPTPRPVELPNIFKGLEKLYWGAFRKWTQILQAPAVIVIIFPVVESEKHTFTLENLIDKLAPLGYTILSEPIIYRRPQAVVQRQICLFSFNPVQK